MTTKSTRRNRLGVGPVIVMASLSYAVLAIVAGRLWPRVCAMPPALRIPEIVASAALLAIGVPFLVVAAVSMNRAFNSGRLATSGVFAITRNPIYAAWIILLLPAIAILSGSWPMLLLPVVAYAAFRRTIGNEDKRIEEEFGEEYLRYPSIGAGAVAAGPGYADGHRDR